MINRDKFKTSEMLWSKLSKAYDTVRKAHMKEMSRFDLTAPQFGVLEVLKKAGPLPLKKISEELMVTGANITCVVDNLEKEQLVQRVHSKTDRRIITAELTDKGKEKMEEIFPNYNQNLSQLFEIFSEEEQKVLIKLLEKLH